MRKKLKIGVVAAAALAALASTAAVALAAGDGPLAGAVHVSIAGITKDGSSTNLTLDRGTVSAFDSSSVTLQEGGGSATVSLGSETQVLGTLKTGAKTLAVSRDGTAVLVAVRGGGKAGGKAGGAARGEKPKLFAGIVHADVSLIKRDGSSDQFAYDRGRITAIDGGSITIQRRDGKSVTLSTGSDTVVREKGQTESVDDLTVGEGAMFFSRGGQAFLIRCISKAKS
jgi:hypothetical protein